MSGFLGQGGAGGVQPALEGETFIGEECEKIE